MSKENEKDIVRIDLTPSQKEQVKTVTDKDAAAIELTVQELEARIPPWLPAVYATVRSPHRAAPGGTAPPRRCRLCSPYRSRGVANSRHAKHVSRP